MITVRLIGGLGNQMFQYALGRKLALKNSAELVLDTSWFGTKDPSGSAVRKYELDCFNVQAKLITKPAANYDSSGYFVRLKRKLGLLKRNVIIETGGGFRTEVLDAPDDSVLNGYWQSEKYFLEIADVIRRDFSFRPTQHKANKTMAEQISSSSAVSLHVRRGDYVASQVTSQFHGTPTLYYYTEAIKEMAKKVSNPHFFIFSDDTKWTKKNLAFDHQVTFVDINSPDKGFEDLRLMSHCQHHILANSSFSWWGAWLNPNPDKIVIAPKRWFKNEAANASHELPESWIRL